MEPRRQPRPEGGIVATVYITTPVCSRPRPIVITRRELESWLLRKGATRVKRSAASSEAA